MLDGREMFSSCTLTAGAGGLRDTNQHKLSGTILCLPAALGCQLIEAATSVRRRFLGSSQASDALANG
jgi:hypothetical protein